MYFHFISLLVSPRTTYILYSSGAVRTVSVMGLRGYSFDPVSDTDPLDYLSQTDMETMGMLHRYRWYELLGKQKRILSTKNIGVAFISLLRGNQSSPGENTLPAPP